MVFRALNKGGVTVFDGEQFDSKVFTLNIPISNTKITRLYRVDFLVMLSLIYFMLIFPA